MKTLALINQNTVTAETALAAALADLRRLDANGWATVTDGTLDQYDVNERLEIVLAAVASIRANA